MMDFNEYSELEDFDNSETLVLSDDYATKVAEWSIHLIENNYDLTNDLSIWQAAGFLIAEGESDLSIEKTAIILTFCRKDWETLKSL